MDSYLNWHIGMGLWYREGADIICYFTKLLQLVKFSFKQINQRIEEEAMSQWAKAALL